VDIGSHTVKVCQLRRVGDMYELEKFGSAEIYAAGDQPSDAREQQAAKVAALKRALEDGQIKAKHTVSAICGESIIVRYLQLPEMPEDELKKALQWEAEEYIPFRLNEVNLDSMVLGHGADGDHSKMEVLLVSAKKDLVESHVSILRDAGLEPRIVEVDSFAFLNCYEANHNPAEEDCVALVNIGGQITSINIFNRGVSRFSRDIPVGGDTMTTAIKVRLNCSYRDAENYKVTVGAPHGDAAAAEKEAPAAAASLLETIRGTVEEMAGSTPGSESPEDVAGKAIQGVLLNLFSEVRRSVEFFENQSRGLNVQRIVLGGGSARLSSLREYFESELHLPVEMIDPLRRVRPSARMNNAERLSEMRQQLGVGIGLGLRGLAA
jgi:type IV pilus assembly protein PilM